MLFGEGHDLLSEPLSDTQKNSLEWRTRFDDFLRQIDESKPGVGVFLPQGDYLDGIAGSCTAGSRSGKGGQSVRPISGLVKFSGREHTRLVRASRTDWNCG